MKKTFFLMIAAIWLIGCDPGEVVTPVEDVETPKPYHSFDLTSDDRAIIVTYQSNVYGIDMVIAPTLEEANNPTAQTYQKHWEYRCIWTWVEIPFRPAFVRIVSPDGYNEVKTIEQ